MKTALFILISALTALSPAFLPQEPRPRFGLVESEEGYLSLGEVDTSPVRGPMAEGLPARWFLNERADIPVQWQGGVPACVGYSVASAVGLRLGLLCGHRCGCRWEQQPFSASFLYNLASGGQMTAISYSAALKTLAEQGICLTGDFPNNPYSATPLPTDKARKAARAYRFWAPERIFLLPRELPGGNARDSLTLDLLRSHLAHDLPVMVGLRCPDSFFDFKGEGYMPGEIGDLEPNHAALIVGYDDTADNGPDKPTGQVELLNSFGTGWGKGGLCRISYRDFCRMAKYGYVARLNGGQSKACDRP